jgi:hypothetical protein
MREPRSPYDNISDAQWGDAYELACESCDGEPSFEQIDRALERLLQRQANQSREQMEDAS